MSRLKVSDLSKLPLNGTKTHPLTPHALNALRSLTNTPRPYQEFNPGVRNRLLREDLVREVNLPSPYKNRKGGVIHFEITAEGLARVLAAGEPKR